MSNGVAMISDALFDALDVLNVLPESVLKQPKDSDGTIFTIEDCLENIVFVLQQLEAIDMDDLFEAYMRERKRLNKEYALEDCLENIVFYNYDSEGSTDAPLEENDDE